MTEPTPPVAWHGSAALKAEAITRMHTHREADAIVQGIYQELNPSKDTGYRGCLVGCLIPPVAWARGEAVQPPDGWHAAVERQFGIDQRVAHLFDSLFETLPEDDCADFAVDSLVAVPVGADLTYAPRLWAADVLTNRQLGMRRLVPRQYAGEVDRVVRLLRGDGTAEGWETAYHRTEDAVNRLVKDLGTDSIGRPELWALQAVQGATVAPRLDHGLGEPGDEYGWRYVIDDAAAATRAHLEQTMTDGDERPFLRWLVRLLLRHIAEAPVPGVWEKQPDDEDYRSPLLARIGEPPC